ncbi:MAG: substrate-binding domain-containing protein [Chloroflexi bacterium]|nr:substrate-binding domain-containing protein [Chloroflexota bacterium]
MPLDRERVVRTALQLLNDVGLERLTLRLLAARLDVRAPTLYWHVKNKQDLLDEMAAMMLADLLTDLSAAGRLPPDTPWQDWLVKVCLALRRLLLGYRDGAKLFSSARQTDTALLPSFEAPMRKLADAGASPDDAARGWATLSSYAIGYTLDEPANRPRPDEQDGRLEVAVQAPRIDAATTSLDLADGWTRAADGRFEHGVRLIVAGIERSLASRPMPPLVPASRSRRNAKGVVRTVTIRDVARRAGVSLSTVSQVVNGRSGYASNETRDRVLAVAHELGYRPNALARGLITSRTGTLGVVITDITRGYFTQVVGSIEQVVSAQGYSLLLACADGVQPEQQALETFVDKRVDGIICMSRTVETSADHILAVAHLGIPVVTINRPLHTTELHQIAWDDVEIGRRATEHLIGLGHRRIAHMSGPLHPPGRRSAMDRVSGFTAALEAAGLPLDETLMVEGSYEYQTAFAACARLFDRDDPPTAVFAASDDMAAAIVNALHRRHLRVPEDVSVVGANDDEYAVHVEPPLTTVRPPVVAAGRRAAEVMLATIGMPTSAPPVREMLASELIVRASTAPCLAPDLAPARPTRSYA